MCSIISAFWSVDVQLFTFKKPEINRYVIYLDNAITIQEVKPNLHEVIQRYFAQLK